jgi:5-methylcytosine-specific restriction protein A
MSWDPARKHGRKHRQTAAWVIAKAGGLCQIQGQHCIRVATEDDHIVPLFEGGTDALTNHQAACSPCHCAKTQAEAARAKQMINAKATRQTPVHPGLKQ